MSYVGDFRLGDTFDVKFCTVQSTGAPTTLAGSPVISAYPGNSTTELTAGITLTVDFDARTGMHNVRVVASGGNGYATATNYTLVITTGTVNAVSAVGYVVGEFSIENRSAVMPTTAARTLDVSATGEAGVDWANVGSPTTTLALTGTTISTSQVAASVTGAVGSVAANGITNTSFDTAAGLFSALGIIDQGTAQAATGTTLQLRSAASFGANGVPVGATILIVSATAGAGQRRIINSYVDSTDTATVDTWDTTPTGTIVYKVFATAPASAALLPSVNTTQFAGQTVTAAAGVTLPSSVASPTNITAGTITTVTNLTNAPTAGDLTATMKTSVTTAATAATPTISTLGANTITATSIASNAITAAKVATDAIGAAQLATDAVTEITTAVLTTAMTESYSTDGGTTTLAQALYLIQQRLGDFSISGTTLTVKGVDGSTTKATYTLSDATNPVSITRAT